MLVYHGPLEKDSSAAVLATDLLMVGFFFLFFSFLGIFSLDHRVSMQDINRCLLVEAREKLPIGVTDL